MSDQSDQLPKVRKTLGRDRPFWVLPYRSAWWDDENGYKFRRDAAISDWMVCMPDEHTVQYEFRTPREARIWAAMDHLNKSKSSLDA
jgi:hypothetical protein